jgi:hypothetical protein
MVPVAEVLVLFAAVGGSGAMVGILAWLHNRLKRLDEENVLLRSQYAQLEDEVGSVRDELLATRKEVFRLDARAEFTERLLSANPSRPEHEE